MLSTEHCCIWTKAKGFFSLKNPSFNYDNFNIFLCRAVCWVDKLQQKRCHYHHRHRRRHFWLSLSIMTSCQWRSQSCEIGGHIDILAFTSKTKKLPTSTKSSSSQFFSPSLMLYLSPPNSQRFCSSPTLHPTPCQTEKSPWLRQCAMHSVSPYEII